LAGQPDSPFAAVTKEQSPAAAVLARAAVGPVAEQEPAVLARLVTIADEHPDQRTDRNTAGAQLKLGHAGADGSAVVSAGHRKGHRRATFRSEGEHGVAFVMDCRPSVAEEGSRCRAATENR
jgi:hypothetical protein